jgi:hypothetical protein
LLSELRFVNADEKDVLRCDAVHKVQSQNPALVGDPSLLEQDRQKVGDKAIPAELP